MIHGRHKEMAKATHAECTRQERRMHAQVVGDKAFPQISSLGARYSVSEQIKVVTE